MVARKMWIVGFTVMLSAGMSGCGVLPNGYSVIQPPMQVVEEEEPAQVVKEEESAQVKMAITTMSPPPPVAGVDIVGVSYATADSLVSELAKRDPLFNKGQPFLATSFVNLNDMENSSEFGLVIADQISARFTQHGFTLIEPRLRSELTIKKKTGEFMLSRDVGKIQNTYHAYAVIVGHYSLGPGVIYLTTKIVQTSNNQILASINSKLPLQGIARDLLNRCCTPVEVVDQ